MQTPPTAEQPTQTKTPASRRWPHLIEDNPDRVTWIAGENPTSVMMAAPSHQHRSHHMGRRGEPHIPQDMCTAEPRTVPAPARSRGRSSKVDADRS